MHTPFTPQHPVEPWAVRETGIDLDKLAQNESIFAVANGHIGMRGNLDEGDPSEIAGTYLNGVHESRTLPYAENAFGNPEAGETVLNITDGKLLRLLVGDELFDVRHGELIEHERVLDFREGVLKRSVLWRSPVGLVVKVTSTRLVSFAQRGAAAILYEVEAVSDDIRIVVQSELVANEQSHEEVVAHDEDPRKAAMLVDALVAEEQFEHGDTVLLLHRTRRSKIRMAAAMAHAVSGPDGMEIDTDVVPDVGRVTIAADIPKGKKLRVLKFIAYGWSAHRTLPSVRAQVLGSLAEARHTGWQGLCDAQKAYLDDFWESADVEIDGDPELQQAVRFALFHCLQAGARSERRAIAAKGLTGSGYDGHAFWDTETYVLPLLTYTAPQAAADALAWRFDCLDAAYERAHQLGLEGAAFPWRTITGRECSGYWPAGTAGFHINADIADAVLRQQKAVDDEEWDRQIGLPLLVGTARLWDSLGHFDLKGHFRISGVTGPDEYSALVDDNVYTNLMAARNLIGAAEAVDRFPVDAAALGVGADEQEKWRAAAAEIYVPFDEVLGVHQQDDGFTHHDVWDFKNTPAEHYPLLLHAPYFDLYRKQVVKQADLVFALYSCGEHFDAGQKAKDFAYYESITVRDSSLSAAIQSIMAAETGHLELAYTYMCETARVDLDDLAGNTKDGLHMASLAGSWLALVAGFGGFRDQGPVPSFSPRLPSAFNRFRFRLTIRGSLLVVTVSEGHVEYEVRDGPALAILHEGEPIELVCGSAVTRPLVPPPLHDAPTHPQGREPGVYHRRLNGRL
jgi:alpha,alpha-trehalose phosphorylase